MCGHITLDSVNVFFVCVQKIFFLVLGGRICFDDVIWSTIACGLDERGKMSLRRWHNVSESKYMRPVVKFYIILWYLAGLSTWKIRLKRMTLVKFKVHVVVPYLRNFQSFQFKIFDKNSEEEITSRQINEFWLKFYHFHFNTSCEFLFHFKRIRFVDSLNTCTGHSCVQAVILWLAIARKCWFSNQKNQHT